MEVVNLNSTKDYKDIDSQIKHETSKLSKKRLSYDYLWGVLANLLLNVEKGHRKFSYQDINEKREEIINSLVS